MKRSKIVILFLFFSINFFGQEKIDFKNIFTSEITSLTIKNQEVYSEKGKVKNIHFVIENDTVFKKIHKKFINQGIDFKHHWIKINLKNKSNTSHFIFEFNQTNIDSLHVFLVKKKQIITTFPTKGLFFEEYNKPHFLSNKYAYLYDVHLPKNENTQLYLRADVHDAPFRVISKLWRKENYQFREKDIKIRTTYLVMFIGFAMLILILSVAMFIFAKHQIYFYYFGFVSVIILNILTVRDFVSPLIIEKYLFLDNNFSEMFGYLQMFFILLYTDEFFGLKKTYSKVSKRLQRIASFIGLFFIAALFLRKYEWFYNFSYAFSKILMLLNLALVYAIAFWLAFKKNRMAYYYLVAYFPLTIFVGHYILTAMKLTTSYNPLQWELVIFIEILVLTIAMAHRYYLLMKENSDYQQVIIKEQEKGIKAMIEAQENERAKIARELHDGVVQQIGSVILRARTFLEKNNLTKKSESQELLQNLEQSNQDLRTISHQMMPRALKELGIVPALKDLLESSLHFANIGYIVESFNLNDRLPKNIEITLYRITQELINNIIKHSKATEVQVMLYTSGNDVILIVEDNGVGIKKINKKGIGLLNITSRLDAVKGNVHFESSPKRGTLVTVKIPIKHAN